MKKERKRETERYKSSRWKCYCKSASRSELTSSSDAPSSDILCIVQRTFENVYFLLPILLSFFKRQYSLGSNYHITNYSVYNLQIKKSIIESKEMLKVNEKSKVRWNILFYNFSILSHFLITCNPNVMKYLTYKKNVYKKNWYNLKRRSSIWLIALYRSNFL